MIPLNAPTRNTLIRNRLACLLCAAALLFTVPVFPARAEEEISDPLSATSGQQEEAGDQLTADSEAFSGAEEADNFTAEEARPGWPEFPAEGEYVTEDPDNGVWEYRSPKLIVQINRQTQTKPSKQVWYEAEVWVAEGGDYPRMIANDPENWGKIKKEEYPYKIARKNGVVLAVSSDFAHLRKQQGKYVGVVIRNGKIISDRTYRSGNTNFPNLDCLAVWPDGNMEVYDSKEKTAAEYLEAGVTDVLAFGPVLIRDGQLTDKAVSKKNNREKAQRVAVGMVERGHYFFMMLEGRLKRSVGAGVSFLAEKLLEKGCTLAINLDGGQTSCIVFMGHQLCKIKQGTTISSRRTCDILGVGYSENLPGVKDGFP